MENEVKRIEWADYYKAIAILLVVIGHATGKFNGYIYQFHVAAFFFISGYLSQIDKKAFDQIIILRFFNLILPYLCYGILGITIFAILQHNHVLQFVSATWEVIPPWIDNIKNIFHGVYCDWLGATWFLISLFMAYIFSKICLMLDENKAGVIYVIITFCLYNIGYKCHNLGINPVFLSGFSHYAIIQLYFSAGHFYRKWENVLNNKVKVKLIPIIMIVNILAFIGFRKLGYTVDLVSTTVNTPLIDAMMAGNGICFLICFTKLIEITNLNRIKKMLEFIGKNTFGILIYHFIGFKIVTIIFIALNICEWSDIALLCPLASVSTIWWWLYVLVAVSFSLVLWNLTTKINIIKFISGIDGKRYREIYQKYKDVVE